MGIFGGELFRGVATGVYIGIYTPKSTQVNFLWGKMTSERLFNTFIPPKQISGYAPETVDPCAPWLRLCWLLQTCGWWCAVVVHALSTDTPLVVSTASLVKRSLFWRRETQLQLGDPALHAATDPRVTWPALQPINSAGFSQTRECATKWCDFMRNASQTNRKQTRYLAETANIRSFEILVCLLKWTESSIFTTLLWRAAFGSPT